MPSIFFLSCKFQFALPRGERPRLVVVQRPNPVFQFALPRGERRVLPSFIPRPVSFNSRSRVGSDSSLLLSLLVDCGFNSRSRVGSDGSMWRVAKTS